MPKMSGRRNLAAILSIGTIGAAFSIGVGTAFAGDNVTEGRFVQTIRNRATRSLSSAERDEIATIAKDKPNIDLEINFDYNSAAISKRSLSSVSPRAQ
jgi:hypothetical protein